MAWSLALLLIAASIVLVTYMHRAVQKIRKNSYAYPSEAIIDQILPPEVIEQIIIHTDYNTIMACLLVSKYWHYHATKSHIQQHVFRNEASLLRLDPAELKEDIRTKRPANEIDIKWTTYPENYPAKYVVEDQLLAKTLGKRLIEADLVSARAIRRTIYHKNLKDLATTSLSEFKHLVKLRGCLEYNWKDKWSISDQSKQSFTIDMDEIPGGNKYHFSPGVPCDVIVELLSVNNDRSNFTSGVRKFRLLDDRPHFVGLPVSSIFAQIGFILLLPCIVVDYRNSSAHESKFSAKIILAAIFQMYAILVSVAAQMPASTVTPVEATRKKRKIGIIITVILLIIGAVFYRWSLELTMYLIMLSGCSIYVIVWSQINLQKNTTTRIALFISCCLVILMNDWKLTVDAFKSGEILRTFLYNIGMHLQFGVIIGLHSLLITYYRAEKVTWKELKMTSGNYLAIFLMETIATVYITLYAPTTTNKAFE